MNNMRVNVWLLSFCQAMMNTGNVLLLSTSALVGYHLVEDKSLATLPLGLQFFSTMLLTIPASMLMKHIGRRLGFIVGIVLGLTGASLAAWAIWHGSFMYFTIGAIFIGAYNGFGTYYRFAAADAATLAYRPTAISYVMAGGVIAAIIGPNLANWTSGVFSGAEFAASYLAIAGLYTLSLLALLLLSIPRPDAHEAHDTGRPLRQIVSQGSFLVAVMGAALGYGIMSLVMTATPLAMHQHAHPYPNTTFVIEWHVLGMFAPSFVTGHLIRRFGVLNIMLTGVLLNILCVVVNLNGTALPHFWLALFCLGVGWNFLFVGSTTLLTDTYRIEEKAKVQALNDFSIFAMVTLSSLSAGALHYHFGWRAINLGVLPLITMILLAVVWLKYQQNNIVTVPLIDDQNPL